jgi:hypothetical protein
MSLTAKLNLLLNLEHTKALDLNTLRDAMNLTRGVSLTNGTGANQADSLFHDVRTLADAANETLDLHDGTLVNGFGDTVTLNKLKGIYIKNNSLDANLLIGGAATVQLGIFNDVTDVLKLPPGGDFFMTAPGSAGVDVTTNSKLKIAHDGTGTSSLTYDIIVVGVD